MQVSHVKGTLDKISKFYLWMTYTSYARNNSQSLEFGKILIKTYRKIKNLNFILFVDLGYEAILKTYLLMLYYYVIFQVFTALHFRNWSSN